MAIAAQHLLGLVFLLVISSFSRLVAANQAALPSYHYGAPISVECMNRSS